MLHLLILQEHGLHDMLGHRFDQGEVHILGDRRGRGVLQADSGVSG